MTVKVIVTYHKSTRIIHQVDPEPKPDNEPDQKPIIYKLNCHKPNIKNYSKPKPTTDPLNTPLKRFSRSKRLF